VLAVGLTAKRSLHAADVSALQVAEEKKDKDKDKEEGIGPFEKCGGSTYSGPSCCRVGCACIIQSRFYSQCEAPGGGMKCNVAKAESEVMAAKERALEARPAALEAEKAAKLAMETAQKALGEMREAEASLATSAAKGRTVRSAKDQQERIVADAKHQAEAAEKAAKAKLGQYLKVKEEIEGINKTAALRAHGQCGAMFSNCGPVAPPKLTEYMACCQEGCVCEHRDAYYAQCRPPPGEGGCSPAGEARHVKERKETMAKLQKEHEALEARMKHTKEHAEKVDKEANEIRHKAAEAGTHRVEAHKLAMHKKAIAQARKREAERLKKTAQSKKNAVHYSEEAIESWKKAAKGIHCGGEAAGDELQAEPEEEEEEKEEMESDGDGDDMDGEESV